MALVLRTDRVTLVGLLRPENIGLPKSWDGC
jgi:hypothetical protein